MRKMFNGDGDAGRSGKELAGVRGVSAKATPGRGVAEVREGAGGVWERLFRRGGALGTEEGRRGTGPARRSGVHAASTQRGARTPERRVVAKAEGGQVPGPAGTPVCP